MEHQIRVEKKMEELESDKSKKWKDLVKFIDKTKAKNQAVLANLQKKRNKHQEQASQFSELEKKYFEQYLEEREKGIGFRNKQWNETWKKYKHAQYSAKWHLNKQQDYHQKYLDAEEALVRSKGWSTFNVDKY